MAAVRSIQISFDRHQCTFIFAAKATDKGSNIWVVSNSESRCYRIYDVSSDRFEYSLSSEIHYEHIQANLAYPQIFVWPCVCFVMPAEVTFDFGFGVLLSSEIAHDRYGLG